VGGRVIKTKSLWKSPVTEHGVGYAKNRQLLGRVVKRGRRVLIRVGTFEVGNDFFLSSCLEQNLHQPVKPGLTSSTLTKLRTSEEMTAKVAFYMLIACNSAPPVFL
jgi:hypothetical protein